MLNVFYKKHFKLLNVLYTIPLLLSGCASPEKVTPKYPKMPVYKVPKRPKITLHQKGNRLCMSVSDFNKIRKYDTTLYKRFMKLNKVNIEYNKKFVKTGK